jgi:ABC-type uncharacterized transport system ATPase subunit
MKIRDIITEAQEADLDRQIDQWFKQQELKKRKAEKLKSMSKDQSIGGSIVKGIQQGRQVYNKIKSIATAKIPFA